MVGSIFNLGSGSPKDDGKNGMSSEVVEALIRSQMGVEEQVEPLFQDGKLIGRILDPEYESSGVLEVRLLPPTMKFPRATLRLSINGEVSIRPSDLKTLGDWLSTLPPLIQSLYDQAIADSKSFDVVKLLMSSQGGGK